MRLKSVVFPAPFGPITAKISPGETDSDTPSTAVRPRKRFRHAREFEKGGHRVSFRRRDSHGQKPFGEAAMMLMSRSP